MAEGCKHALRIMTVWAAEIIIIRNSYYFKIHTEIIIIIIIKIVIIIM